MNSHLTTDTMTHADIKAEIRALEAKGDQMTPRDAARLTELRRASDQITRSRAKAATW